ncbi:hypothetical protein NMY22_g5726 [Coprinellus aureogranulatus]|nr:hypothetical protein NMY22_g5726 [Coprinellus aureogranulatus]
MDCEGTNGLQLIGGYPCPGSADISSNLGSPLTLSFLAVSLPQSAQPIFEPMCFRDRSFVESVSVTELEVLGVSVVGDGIDVPRQPECVVSRSLLLPCSFREPVSARMLSRSLFYTEVVPPHPTWVDSWFSHLSLGIVSPLLVVLPSYHRVRPDGHDIGNAFVKVRLRQVVHVVSLIRNRRAWYHPKYL